MKRKSIVALTLAIAAGLLAQQALAKKGGTSILHFMARAAMTGSGTGNVEAKRNQQGGADNQRLEITVADLTADAAYKLLASTTDDSNLVEVAEFTTDSSGNALLDYVKKNKGKGSAGGEPLPVGLDPISKLRSLEVSVGGTQTVLSVDLTAPDSLQYLIKRSMTNDGVDNDAAASLRIKSNGSSNQLRIRASGLDATNTYFLAINGVVADTHTSDASGHLDLTAWPAGSPDALDVTSLGIWNGASNSVLSTSLP